MRLIQTNVSHVVPRHTFLTKASIVYLECLQNDCACRSSVSLVKPTFIVSPLFREHPNAKIAKCRCATASSSHSDAKNHARRSGNDHPTTSIERLKVFTRNNIRDLFRSQGALFKSSFARAQMVQSPGTVWPSDATRPKRYLDEPPVCSTTWCGCLLCAVRRRLSKVPFVLGTYEAAVIVFSLDIHAFVLVLFRSWVPVSQVIVPFVCPDSEVCIRCVNNSSQIDRRT